MVAETTSCTEPGTQKVMDKLYFTKKYAVKRLSVPLNLYCFIDTITQQF